MDILAARRDAAPSFADPVCPPATLPVLVAYDISDHRRRRRLYRLLSGFGEPLQESVFLCWVDAPRRRRLEQALEDFRRAPHYGDERIDCITVRCEDLPPPAARDWIFE